MIGQKKLCQRIEKMLYETNNFPKFAIFVGPKGSGKKTFIKEHFKGIYLENNKIESVRKMIQMVYKVSNETFIMPDADTMSPAARNALLKIVEENPNNNYFIMTLEDINNTLDTIKSRATVFHMDIYTPDEIFEYYWSLEGSNLMPHGMPNDAELVRELCETPGDVQTLVKMRVQKFYDFVNLTFEHIDTASISNVFKIADKISIKNDDGFDLRLFWKAFQWSCMDRSIGAVDKDIAIQYCDWSLITSKYVRQLRTKGVNRQMLFDNWILEIRNGC